MSNDHLPPNVTRRGFLDTISNARIYYQEWIAMIIVQVKTRWSLCALFLLASLAASVRAQQPSQAQTTPKESLAKAAAVDEALFGAMKWRQVGPFRGGRALAVTGVPGESEVFYFGAASGGIWKTTDAGGNWAPIFDHESIASIGAI